LTNIQNFHQYLHVCAQLHETLIELLQKLCKQLARKEMLAGDNFCYLSHNCPYEETTSLEMDAHYNFVRKLQNIQTIGISLQDLLEECILGFKLKQTPSLPKWLLFKAMKQVQK
jgi:hypothetical protein